MRSSFAARCEGRKLAIRIGAACELPRESLTNYGDALRRRRIVPVEAAAANHRNAHRPWNNPGSTIQITGDQRRVNSKGAPAAQPSSLAADS
jgi:hypothetical protein